MKLQQLYRYFKTVREVKGPLLYLERVYDAKLGELVEVIPPRGEIRRGSVIETSLEYTTIQVFEGTEGLDTEKTVVKLLGRTIKIPVSEDLLGRLLNGIGEPIDGRGDVIPEDYVDVEGMPINPTAREYPREFIETGISGIDGMNTLSRGQKLPIFTGSGLPHNSLVAQIATQSKIPGEKTSFAVVLATMGVTHSDAKFFEERLRKAGVMEHSVFIVNLADDPPIERIITPRVALSIAEYLAFERDYHVLVILTDMLNYAEALREVSSAREEIPGRRSFPAYLYTDLASIYERCGRIKKRRGSITLMPIVTMPNDDITHPVPDLTGYITEGQIVLDRSLYHKGIYPPINVLPSLSRLMKEAVKSTREDHLYLSNQLYAAYSRAQEIRDILMVVGEEALEKRDKIYLSFGEKFEKRFVKQGEFEDRSLDETLQIGWDLLHMLPKEELTRIPPEIMEKYYGGV